MSEIARENLVLPASRPSVECPPEKNLAPKWFAVYTAPRHEKRVGQYLGVKQIEHYVPLYQARRKWSDGTTVTLDLPLFPGYLFVRIDRSQRASLPESEIDALRAGLPLRHAEPHPLLTAGQRVRICSGALAGMVGVVVRRKNSLRVVLTMDLIRQSVAVEVDESELETI